MPPALAMWGANLVLGTVALALLAAQPEGRGLRSPRPSAVPRLPSRLPAPERGATAGAPRAPRRPAAAQSPAAGRRGRADPPGGPPLPHPARPLRGPQLPGAAAAGARRLCLDLRPRGVHGPVRRRPAEPREGQGGRPLLRLPHLLDRPLPDPPGRARGRARHLRHPEPPQRDHGHEGGRHEPLSGRPPRDRSSPRSSAPASTGCRRCVLPHTNRIASHGLQRHQGSAAPVLGPARPPLDPRLRQPLLQLRLPLGEEAAGGAGGGPRAPGLRLLRPARLRRGPGRAGSFATLLYAAQASWNGQGYDLERGWRRGLFPQVRLPHFRRRAHPRPRASDLFHPRGAPLRLHELPRAAQPHRRPSSRSASTP